jgi:iron complex outermembrane receptor protein
MPPAAPVALAVDIPAEALALALENLAHQTGLQLVWLDGVVTDQQTRGAPAGLPATEALARLLEGTGLRFESLNMRVARIVPANPPPGADIPPPPLEEC